MSLENQISMYSVDTSNFYFKREEKLHNKIMSFKVQRNYIKKLKGILKNYLLQFELTDNQLRTFERGKYSSIDELKRPDNIYGLKYILKLKPKEIAELEFEKALETYKYYCKLYRYKQILVGEIKTKLLEVLNKRVEENIATNGKHHIRVLREDTLSDKDVICVFESALNRYIGLKKDEFTEALMVVQIYFFDVFKDIEHFGFIYKGEKYRYFTSSAGQIRTKKAVFIQESIWNKLEKTLMCGLTIDKINEKGGNNSNKHLAYLALTNSATDLWKNFDIDRTIVVEDFETMVSGEFDLIDDIDYSIKRITNTVPIPHTDGCGMMLPEVSVKNFMIRAPWIKGLLAVFDFRKFIEVYNASPIITDIYGKTWDISKDNIQIILTKSQFKMWKYYSSWDEYKEYFKKYNCTAGYCNVEEDRIPNSTINYQMLQTFTDFTEKDLESVAKKSIDRMKNLTSSVENLKEIFAVTPYNFDMTPLQKSIEIYPNLLNDKYLKEVIKSIKDSMLKRYRAGHLDVRGKYTFILPDLYACCERWFLGIETPEGLLNDQEVYCRLFPQDEKLDCLRSPHLYKEHAVRKNMACKKLKDKENISKDELQRQELMQEWFNTDAIYTSSKDLISKVLQFDDL